MSRAAGGCERSGSHRLLRPDPCPPRHPSEKPWPNGVIKGHANSIVAVTIAEAAVQKVSR